MKKILIIDIETTGFLNDGGHIVEIAIVELDLENGNRQILFDRVVYEKEMSSGELLNSWILKNSDLTSEKVVCAKSLNELKPEIQGIINTYKFGATAYNNKFDFDFLESRGIRIPVKLACPMLLSTNILKLKGKYGNYKWPSVIESYKYFMKDKSYVEKHRAGSDAMDEAKIVYELYKRGIFKLRMQIL